MFVCKMDHHRYVSLEMIFILCLLSGVYVFECFQQHYLWFPKSVFAMLLGAGMHFIVDEVVFDTELFLFLMLPPMVLRSSLSIPLRDVDSLRPAFVFATCGTLLSCGIITWGCLCFMSFEKALLLGTLLSSTDQVALTTLMKYIRAKVPDRVYWTLQNESFINDAVSITFVHLIQYSGSLVHMGMFLTCVMVVTCVLTRWLAVLMVRYKFVDPQIVLLVALMLYSVGEFLFMSGILLLFLFGFSIRQHAKETKKVCDILSTLLEDYVYLLLGSSSYTFTLNKDILMGLYVCFVCWVSRVCTAFMCGSAFFSVREMCFISMTSIRGAVAVALAFSINDAYIQMIVFVNVLASTILHGSTICVLPTYLHLQRSSI